MTKKTFARLDRDIAEVTGVLKRDYDWASFADGASFAFWASPYMSEVENLADEHHDAYEALSPGPGGAWESVLPDPPASARAVGKKFAKAARDKLTDAELAAIAAKFSAYDAGYYGGMQSQGEGVGWFDRSVNVDPPRGFEWNTKIHNAIYAAIRRGAREAGVKLSNY